MAERVREGEGLPSASRRQFLLWTGGAALGLLLAPSAASAVGLSSAAKRKRGLGAPLQHAKGAAHPTGKATSHLAASRHGSASGHAGAQAHAATGTSCAPPSRPGSSSHGSVASHRAPAVHTGASRGACRSLALYSIHTGEHVSVEYFVDGHYEASSLRAINRVLRDHRNDEVHPIDTRTLNIIHAIRSMAGGCEPIHVVSGYRSPQTNALLRMESSGVAEHSFHMSGQAIDFYLPGRDLRTIRRAALAMRAGGVGYYPYDNFVHVDSGPVRRWG